LWFTPIESGGVGASSLGGLTDILPW